MKVLAIMIVITILFFAFAIWTQNNLETSAKRLEQKLLSLESAIKDQHWDKADDQLEAVIQLWGKTKNTWQIFINHEEIDNIDEALVKVKQLVALKEKADSLAEVSTLRLYIGHIPKKESLRLVNLL